MSIPDVVDIGKAVSKAIAKKREDRYTGELTVTIAVFLTKGGIQKADIETKTKRRIEKAGFKS